jgi:chromosome segregation ATPase
VFELVPKETKNSQTPDWVKKNETINKIFNLANARIHEIEALIGKGQLIEKVKQRTLVKSALSKAVGANPAYIDERRCFELNKFVDDQNDRLTLLYAQSYEESPTYRKVSAMDKVSLQEEVQRLKQELKDIKEAHIANQVQYLIDTQLSESKRKSSHKVASLKRQIVELEDDLVEARENSHNLSKQLLSLANENAQLKSRIKSSGTFLTPT